MLSTLDFDPSHPARRIIGPALPRPTRTPRRPLITSPAHETPVYEVDDHKGRTLVYATGRTRAMRLATEVGGTAYVKLHGKRHPVL